MARAFHTAPLGLAIVLAGCGGGGGSIGLLPPPPASVAPAPAPVPPPAPIPPFPNGSTPTFYSTTHASAVAQVRRETLEGGKSRVVGLDGISFLGGNGIGNFEYRGPDSYAVEFAGFGGPAFGPDDKATTSTLFDIFHTKGLQDSFANLELIRPGTGVRLTYTTFGNVMQTFDSPNNAEITFFVAGAPTPRGEVPTTGSASFTGIADGLWVDGATTRRLYGSPATLTANFASGQVTSRLELRGHADPFGNFSAAATTALGTFVGTGLIASSGSFSGSYGPAAGYSGSFGGKFYGAAASEYGLSFRLTGSSGQTAFGVTIGKKD